MSGKHWYTVNCLEDNNSDDGEEYVQASSRRFTYEGAVEYAATMTEAFRPVIVPHTFDEWEDS